MNYRITTLIISATLVVSTAFPSLSNSQDQPIVVGDNFKKENLVAWCIVPFDAKQRGPEARAKMVRELGMKRVAYDWRDKHIPEFESEILAYQNNNLEYFAFWGWHDSMEPLIKKYKIHPQIWSMFRGKLRSKRDSEKVKEVVNQFLPIAQKAHDLGLPFGIYNHGGWAGEPENMVAVCKALRATHGLTKVGIVYNFHHGHQDIPDFDSTIETVKPYLLCVNINGMNSADSIDPKNQIGQNPACRKRET